VNNNIEIPFAVNDIYNQIDTTFNTPSTINQSIYLVFGTH